MNNCQLSVIRYQLSVMAINIKAVTTIEECREIEEIILAAWGAGYEVSIPDHFTITLAKENGSVVLLARDGEQAVGFCMGFLSYVGVEKQLKHCSHMAGVIPEYRGQRVGEMLKWAQRDAVLEMGIEHITWTYDPLETLNGRLNIHKLGAICTHYERNIYGNGRDALNWGVPTDRFYVDWHLNSTWVQEHANNNYQSTPYADWRAAGMPVVNPPHLEAGIWRCGQIEEDAFAQKRMLVAVPKQFQLVKKANDAWGLEWRLHTRTVFERVFATGFTTIDLLVEESLCYYLLQKEFMLS